jgi:general stress protein 26
MTSDIDTVWKMLEGHKTGFLTTWHGEVLQSRPMALYPRRDEGVICFLTDASSNKDDAIQKYPSVNVSLQDGSSYLSIAGEATATHDLAKIKELWTPFAAAWWDGPTDPSIRLLTLTPTEAHFWKTPGKIVATISMLAAAATGAKKADLGKEKPVPM